MKKIVMSFIGAMMILSLAACTPTTEKNKTSEAAQTTSSSKTTEKKDDKTDKSERSNSVDYDKAAEFNAEILDVVSIYTVKADGSGLSSTMESISDTEMSAQALADMLIQYGVLDAGTEVIDFTTSDELTSEEAVGPGIAKLPNLVIGSGISANGVLNLNQIPDDGKDDLIVYAVARTFMENMNVECLTVQINGETIADSLTMDDVE